MKFANPMIRKCDLNLDGCGLVLCKERDGDYLVMTEKIIEDNPMDNQKLENVLREAFALPYFHIVWLPWDREERLGHTDGLLRYIGQTEDDQPVYSNKSKYNS